MFILLHPHLLHVDLKGTRGLALRTGTRPDLLVLALIEWAQDVGAFEAVVPDHTELRKDGRAAGHHPTGADQLVQVQLPEGTRGGKGGGRGE